MFISCCRGCDESVVIFSIVSLDVYWKSTSSYTYVTLLGPVNGSRKRVRSPLSFSKTAIDSNNLRFLFISITCIICLTDIDSISMMSKLNNINVNSPFWYCSYIETIGIFVASIQFYLFCWICFRIIFTHRITWRANSTAVYFHLWI